MTAVPPQPGPTPEPSQAAVTWTAEQVARWTADALARLVDAVGKLETVVGGPFPLLVEGRQVLANYDRWEAGRADRDAINHTATKKADLDDRGCGKCDWCRGTKTGEMCPHRYICCRNCVECRATNYGRNPYLPESRDAINHTAGDFTREKQLVAAIHDIDAHARPLSIDADGFISGGYTITIGSLHRALALTGTAPLCKDCPHQDGHTAGDTYEQVGWHCVDHGLGPDDCCWNAQPVFRRRPPEGTAT